MKSFYEILEIPEWASAAEIRSAYLKLAREYHPDRVPEHLTKLRADAEDKFKQVQEAWAVLGDPIKRRRYDLQVRGVNPPRPSAPPQQPSRSATKSPFWEALRGRKDLAKWALLVVVVTLVMVVIGEMFVYRETAYRETSGSPASPTAGGSSTKPNISGLQNTGGRQYDTQPRHIQTWQAEGGRGLDFQLLSMSARPDGVEISFRARAGQHSDLLLYEPPGSKGRTRNILDQEVAVDRDFDELYIQDNVGAKYYSTTGFVGGRQVNFNLYNFTRRINFRPREEVVLSAKFPPLNGSASSITLVSPALGKWQPEWRWPAIDVK